jgi:hypothetical protein
MLIGRVRAELHVVKLGLSVGHHHQLAIEHEILGRSQEPNSVKRLCPRTQRGGVMPDDSGSIDIGTLQTNILDADLAILELNLRSLSGRGFRQASHRARHPEKPPE